MNVRLWARVSRISTQITGLYHAMPDGSAPDVVLRTEDLVPLEVDVLKVSFALDHAFQVHYSAARVAQALLASRDLEIARLRAELAVSRANRAADMVLMGQVRDIITEAEK